ncbi:toxic anion resistance protein [Anaerotalea alkaliphila]|uniref:Toxic anion resistance protein n=1 Tax=Anaerotalea alkaliphila TaxID=2662126 RepID=A0A7X5KNS9_9FIRM|nr:toxic anion resistance protein [Anaerotalea alkaliphila]NDL67052.1 toxic anion resistance protein [Anaerotalea alkaliphila]
MGFSMEVLDTERIKKEIAQEVQPVPEEVAKLKELAESNVKEIMTVDLDSMEKRKSMLRSIEEFGMETMKGSENKNRMLQVSVGDLSKRGGESDAIAAGLLELQREIKDLDPSRIDFTKTGILGKLFNPLRAYFDKYQKADSVVNDIVASLDKGKSTLKNDNTTLEIEEVSMRELTKKLIKEIEMGTLMDEILSRQIDNAKAGNVDPDKIRFVSEEVLFPLRQRILDMQQMMVVNQQGIMAVEVIRRNNKELIRGVERAKTVTISAMRIAAMVAGALYNQKIVLKKIGMLNATTNDLIGGTSRMLKEQGAEIHKQSMEANISVDTLKAAFADVIAAMDAISTYKQEALPKMKQTIDAFKELAAEGEQQIQRLEKGSRLSL